MVFIDFLCASNVSLLIGIVWILIASWKLYESINREKNGYITSGKIVDVIGEWTRSGRNWSYSYYPVFQITDQEGKLIERKSSKGIFPNLWTKEKMIPVVYFENDIYPTGLKWMLSNIFLILVGIALISCCPLARYF
ncbi:hypothetical protein GO730_03220 [Spirosoma sp. HMF3257]|uniref:DUF3592 domain-containing protein n=1 Tax=Spirosoma telluris TaxID=2183553 RepID=A0A327NEU8_9BACT|nr:hypothetical protein [Spirosoma telluris]RAI73667.1 hypothetical protein HMF3257_03145 [Spirosoma telluris]